MSSHIVPVALVDQVLPHPDPQTTELEIVHILGWQMVSRKGQFRPGDKVIYVPPQSVLPLVLSDALEVTKYLGKGNRVRSIRLRGEPSFGLTMVPARDWPLGENVAEHYGITRYIPPVKPYTGDEVEEHPLLQRYTEIEHLRTFPDVLEEGEPVIVSEKLDGTNCRVALLDDELVCGSFRVQRSRPTDEGKKRSLYWYPALHLEGVYALLGSLSGVYRQVVLFGELYGPGIRSFAYGVPAGQVGFRVFDCFCDGRYLSWATTQELCESRGVETVPVLFEGPYSLEAVKGLSRGATTLGGATIREGVVVRPRHERTHPRVGRVILKYINDDYLVKQSDGKIADYTEA